MALAGGHIAPGFADTFPSHQNALDIFSGKWSTSFPPTTGLLGGSHPTFADPRVPTANLQLGGLSGRSILELGPFEAYNTYQFQQSGATSITSIESSRYNFLKCLIVKNIFGLSATFLHGDFITYLQQTPSRFDICWASGILYHMISPIDLLKGIRRVADIVYIWSHYYDAARAKNRIEFDELKNITYSEFSRSIHLHHRNYPDQGDGSFFSGGNQTYSYWMKKDDIIFVLSELGYGRIELLGDEPDYPPGPAFGLLARTS